MREIPQFSILSGEQLGGKVIQLERPYIIASVYSYHRDDEEVQEKMEDMVQGRYPIAKVDGYTIFLITYTSLEPCDDADLQQTVLNEMADFFLNEKIQEKPGKYMKSEESGRSERRILREGERRKLRNRIKRTNEPND